MSQLNLKSAHEHWLHFLLARLGQNSKQIIFTDTSDIRVLQACAFLLRSSSVKPILIANRSVLIDQARSLGINLEGAEFYSPIESAYANEWSDYISSSPKLKVQKNALLENPLAFGSFLLKKGLGHGLVAGASVSTGEVIKCLLSFVGLKPRSSWATSSFVMIHPSMDFASKGLAVFADCGVIPEPTEDQLFEITLRAQSLMKDLFYENPRIALLSFSTSGSSTHPAAEKMRFLKYRLKAHDPLMEVEGEIQFDAAVDGHIREQKGLSKSMMENANIFIFPNLDAGNIGYKIMQRTSQSLALGPLLHGFPMPISDLSRGCSVEDIVLTSLVVACQD